VPAGQVSTLTLDSTAGQQATATSPTQVPAIDCRALGFSPRLRLALRGRRQTGVGGHPTLTTTIIQRRGQANIASSKVTLPLSLALDPRNSQHVCAVAAAAADKCPARTIIGTARVATPLLSRPLTGNVYLVQGIRTTSSGQRVRTLPALLVALRGAVAIDLHAQTSVSHLRLVTTFSSLPDLPSSTFTLTINGGRKGILVVTGHRSLCTGRQVAPILLIGHNGRRERHKRMISTPCPAPNGQHR
jgi:hypothetical protein